MFRIKEIELREVQLPLKEPFRISSGTSLQRRILLVRVTDAEGTVGWGESVAGALPNYCPETIDTVSLALQKWIAPRVLGKGFSDPREIEPLLSADFRGHKMAKAAVEMACWELAARLAGQSLSRFLGGTRESIEVGISLGIQETPAQLAEKAHQALEEGYRKIKLKIMPGSDIEFVRAVRERLPQAPLMADANNAYRLDDWETLRQLDEFGLVMIEQPLAWDDIAQHAELQRRLKTPVCLDESITGPRQAQAMIDLSAGKIVNIKPGRVGGISASKKIHDICESSGIPVWCGGMLESGVGRAHNVALASLPNFRIPGDVSPSSRYWKKDIVTPEWTMDRNGRVKVPVDRPGMGVEVDLDRVEDLTVSCVVLN